MLTPAFIPMPGPMEMLLLGFCCGAPIVGCIIGIVLWVNLRNKRDGDKPT